MRYLLILALALPLAAQYDVVLMGKRPSLARSGLAAGVQAGSGRLAIVN